MIMNNIQKIKCDCGNYLQENETIIDHTSALAMVCPKCGFTTLTKEQAKELRPKSSIMDLAGAWKDVSEADADKMKARILERRK